MYSRTCRGWRPAEEVFIAGYATAVFVAHSHLVHENKFVTSRRKHMERNPCFLDGASVEEAFA